MEIPVLVNEHKLRQAIRATETRDPTELIHRLLDEAIARAAAYDRLARSGGTMPDLEVPPRRGRQAEE
jgi:hypothetical protein